jgi:hypothetical protein
MCMGALASQPSTTQVLYSATGREPATAALTALRPIAVGEEMCQAYIDAASAPTQLRRQRLLAQFGFLCTCSLCADAAGRAQGGDGKLKEP